MTPSLLIAGNFLREQRWFVVFLLLYVAVLTFIFSRPPMHPVELLLLEKQLAALGIFFGFSTISGSLQIERRTRRNVAVLSKGISRGEYLAGFLLGNIAIFGIYGLAMLASAMGLQGRVPFPMGPFIAFVVVTFFACVLASAIALFFATVLHPLFAMAATAIVVAAPFALAQLLGPGALNTIAVAALLESIIKFSFAGGWSLPWPALALATIQTFMFWFAATWMFSRRDIAIAVE